MTTGTKVDELEALRERIRAKESDLKELKEMKASMEMELLDIMETQGMTKLSGSKGTISISETVVPTVDDWDAFYKFLHRSKAYHMMERRVSSTAYREELETRRGQQIPGVSSYTKRKLNLRSINS